MRFIISVPPIVILLALAASSPGHAARTKMGAIAKILDAGLTKSCPGNLQITDEGTCTDGLVVFDISGTLNVPSIFLERLANTLEDTWLVQPIVSEVEELGHEHQHTIREGVEHVGHEAHQLAEAVKPVEFVVDHALEHFIIHAVAHGLHEASHHFAHHAHELAHAAEHGAHSLSSHVNMYLAESAEVLAKGLGGLSIVTEALGQALSLPFMVGLFATFDWFLYQRELMQKQESSMHFATALRWKGKCFNKRLFRHPSSGKVWDFKPAVREICAERSLETLKQEMTNANHAVVQFFDQVGAIGSCLYPLGNRSAAKTECILAILPRLRESDGKMGLILSAIHLAQILGTTTDDLLNHDVYGHHVSTIFNMPIAPNITSSLPGLVEQAGDSNATAESRSIPCVSLIAKHRAFARTFGYMTRALTTWMRTFARDINQRSMEASWTPCRRVVNSLEKKDVGFCKNKHTKLPESNPVDVCGIATTSLIWE